MFKFLAILCLVNSAFSDSLRNVNELNKTQLLTAEKSLSDNVCFGASWNYYAQLHPECNSDTETTYMCDCASGNTVCQPAIIQRCDYQCDNDGYCITKNGTRLNRPDCSFASYSFEGQFNTACTADYSYEFNCDCSKGNFKCQPSNIQKCSFNTVAECKKEFEGCRVDHANGVSKTSLSFVTILSLLVIFSL